MQLFGVRLFASFCHILAAVAQTWNFVDIGAAVCSKPPGANSSVYRLYIADSPGIKKASPYIISFLRSSRKNISISFRVDDASGDEVVPNVTVNLQDLTLLRRNCSCSNLTIFTETMAGMSWVHGPMYGTSCNTSWDQEKCGQWFVNQKLGDWCCRRWCFTEPGCPNSYPSPSDNSVYYSYSACEAENKQLEGQTCSWTAAQKQLDPCACRDVSNLFSDSMNRTLPVGYGATCKAWDADTCAQKFPADMVDSWCCESWCYVDQSCPTAVADMLNDDGNGTRWRSRDVCLSDPLLLADCPYKPDPKSTSILTSGCSCLNVTMPSSLLPSGTPLNYGSFCQSWDYEKCEIYRPNRSNGVDCCKSWCWVNNTTCPNAQESTVWPGHYFSDASCSFEVDKLLNCKWNKTVCACLGVSPKFSLSSFQPDYGSSCKAWDSENCANRWSDVPAALWDSTSHDWCCSSWCYVSADCPMALSGWLDARLYYSYKVCNNSNSTYLASDDRCLGLTRLLGANETNEEEQTEAARDRRLSSRRRGGFRRRTPSRRRVSALRRRSPYVPARRRTVYDYRRRTIDINGKSNTVLSRRRSVELNSSPRRRELSRRRYSTTSYGYTDTFGLLANYNNQFPYRTPYGYSGYNAYPAYSVRSTSFYSEQSSNPYDCFGCYYTYGLGVGNYTHRRRIGNVQWCIMTSLGQGQEGDVMECNLCIQRFTEARCRPADSCMTASGCGYSSSKNFTRDDIVSTGFVPGDFQFPLTVTIFSISGPDIDNDATLCPPSTQAEMDLSDQLNKTFVLSANLFVVLTEQDFLSNPSVGCVFDSLEPCADSTDCEIPGTNCSNATKTCICSPGSCWSGSQCAKLATTDKPTSSGHLEVVSLVIVLILSFFVMA